MKHEHDSILRVILIDQLACFDFLTEAAGYIGYTGISRIAVDICFYTILTN